jgi:septal ring factor EnvC (AmiA/AmiB activator)
MADPGDLNFGTPDQQTQFGHVRESLLALMSECSSRIPLATAEQAEYLRSERRRYARLLREITPTDDHLAELDKELAEQFAKLTSS